MDRGKGGLLLKEIGGASSGCGVLKFVVVIPLVPVTVTRHR
jgi:hypothetical protein